MAAGPGLIEWRVSPRRRRIDAWTVPATAFPQRTRSRLDNGLLIDATQNSEKQGAIHGTNPTFSLNNSWSDRRPVPAPHRQPIPGTLGKRELLGELFVDVHP